MLVLVREETIAGRPAARGRSERSVLQGYAEIDTNQAPAQVATRLGTDATWGGTPGPASAQGWGVQWGTQKPWNVGKHWHGKGGNAAGLAAPQQRNQPAPRRSTATTLPHTTPSCITQHVRCSAVPFSRPAPIDMQAANIASKVRRASQRTKRESRPASGGHSRTKRAQNVLSGLKVRCSSRGGKCSAVGGWRQCARWGAIFESRE